MGDHLNSGIRNIVVRGPGLNCRRCSSVIGIPRNPKSTRKSRSCWVTDRPCTAYINKKFRSHVMFLQCVSKQIRDFEKGWTNAELNPIQQLILLIQHRYHHSLKLLLQINQHCSAMPCLPFSYSLMFFYSHSPLEISQKRPNTECTRSAVTKHCHMKQLLLYAASTIFLEYLTQNMNKLHSGGFKISVYLNAYSASLSKTSLIIWYFQQNHQKIRTTLQNIVLTILLHFANSLTVLCILRIFFRFSQQIEDVAFMTSVSCVQVDLLGSTSLWWLLCSILFPQNDLYIIIFFSQN